jgi:hypothetical protein
MRRTARPNKRFAIALLSSLATLGLCAFQFGDRNGLNNMPFSQVQALVSDLAKAKLLAKQGNLEILAGQPVRGQAVRLRGELTDGNCFLNSHTHAYDHAFCAKLCVASGSPLLFISDEGSRVYLVLTAPNGVRLPGGVLDEIGVPGIIITGKSLDAGGLNAVAIEGLPQDSVSKN